MIVLCFSRTTGFPFTQDCPSVAPLEDGTYRVYSSEWITVKKTDPHGIEYTTKEHKPIGEGNIEEAIAMLIAHLPPNCGPAINGTANDLEKDKG